MQSVQPAQCDIAATPEWADGSRANTVDDSLARICDFLLHIGVEVRADSNLSEGFLPGVRIVAGGIRYDRSSLRWPADLLHEAGHIAVTPADRRHVLDGALDGAKASAYGGEVEAIAWSWAALLHLGLPPTELFHPEGYRGHSEALLRNFVMGVYPGAHGLAQAGLTLVGASAPAAGIAPYPHMQRWLRL